MLDDFGKLEITKAEKIELKPGDILIFYVKGYLSDADKLQKHIEKLFPENKVLIVNSELISVLQVQHA